jgi:hypothetical protein
LKTKITYDSTGDYMNHVNLESVEVLERMPSGRLYRYINSVRDDLYRCKSLEGESENTKKIEAWVQTAYKILNGRECKSNLWESLGSLSV